MPRKIRRHRKTKTTVTTTTAPARRRARGRSRKGKINKLAKTGNFYQLSRYVPYSGYSVTGTGANTTIHSVIGDFFCDSQAFTSTSASPADNTVYTFSSANLVFGLSDIFDYAEFSTLFEMYRIAGISLKFRYLGAREQNTLYTIDDANPAHKKYMAANPSAFLAYRWMHQAEAAYANTAVGWSHMQDSSKVKTFMYPSKRVVKTYLKPITMTTVQKTAGDVDDVYLGTPKRSPWISIAYPSIPHYGIQLMAKAEPFETDTANATIRHGWNIEARYYIQMKYRLNSTTD